MKYIHNKNEKSKTKLFSNFWNGKERLRTSFWAVYIIGGTIVSLPAIVLPETSSAIFIFVPFQFIYLIWAMVGTWRSALKFKPKKKTMVLGNNSASLYSAKRFENVS